MPNNATPYAAITLAVIIIILIIFAVVGHIGFEFYYSFSLMQRVLFGVGAVIMILGLFAIFYFSSDN